VAAELTLVLLPVGSATRIAVAILLACAGARAAGGTRITLAQAATAAILTVAVADGRAGVYRLLDALTGAAVALVFSQFLFSPEPVRLVRAAEAAALDDISDGLALTARALEEDDDECLARAVDSLRDTRDPLGELHRVRRVGTRVARRSAVWRRQHAPVVRETENAAHLDLLGSSCLMLARMASATDSDERDGLAMPVRALADAVGELRDGLGSREARQQVADRALALARELGEGDAPSDPALRAAIIIARSAAADAMTFAGVDAEEAVAAVRAGRERPAVPEPAATPRPGTHLRHLTTRIASAGRRARSRLTGLRAARSRRTGRI
jgi:hypothetical protein